MCDIRPQATPAPYAHHARMRLLTGVTAMTKYAALRHSPRKRVVLSRSTKILSTAVFLLLISLFAVVRPPAKAAAANPIYATFQYVDNAISTALAPIQSAIASLQQQQTSQATQISNQQNLITDLQTQQASQAQQITNLQNSTSKSLKVYDANGQELGLAMGVGGNGASIFSPSLNEFIYIAANGYAELPNANSGILTSGIGNIISRIFYQSSDCTGNPYAPTDNGFYTNQVLAFSPTENFTYHSSDPMTTVTTFSLKSWSSPNTCQSGIAHFDGWPLYPVTLPFPTPIAQPVQFKYQ
jgi:hypothetical protein